MLHKAGGRTRRHPTGAALSVSITTGTGIVPQPTGVTMNREVRTCRHCLGAGCVHCNHRGQFARRLERRELNGGRYVRTPEQQASVSVLAYLRSGQPDWENAPWMNQWLARARHE